MSPFTHIHRRLADTTGQTVVEFALAVPLLCFFLLLVVSLGAGVVRWVDATHLANSYARLATVNATHGSPSLLDWIGTQVAATPNSSRKVCVTVDSSFVKVEVYVHTTLIPTGVTLALPTASATMRLEQSPTSVLPGGGTGTQCVGALA